MCKLFCNSLRDFKLFLLLAVFIFIYGQLKPVLIHVGEYHQIFAWVSLASTCHLVYTWARDGENSGKQELAVANFLLWSSLESGYLLKESQVQLWDLEGHLTTS